MLSWFIRIEGVNLYALRLIPAQRPPVEKGVVGQQVTLGFQPRTLMAQDFDQRVQRLKPGIGDGGIGQGPQSLQAGWGNMSKRCMMKVASLGSEQYQVGESLGTLNF